ncbi:predicted protein [Phaeodactylum tricornutum CCAP 1055/1]|jgi:acyl-coenzyme A thioesterase PaaI-like protein|uniref:Thioesterase domain-containing protein n=1 Tax=Phaeodactylum tricornutum (strain CCAP 1055/1) TaxID=556484 RepID=B7FRA3_PHATC|nr:predicted protein [Phaeodactylum tricornutum CCAP 1055/1]EEC50973.1 predicted protein [Phaeodactylum tricornutum CCAP 1055/1]|eukprot:XP_002176510.1 predicted protein [Phaeodactylum tricornutum CCAP 1055/1]
MSSSASARSIQRLFEFLKLQGRVEKSPGFSSALGLTYERISKLPSDSLSFQDQTLKVRLPLASEMLLPKQDSVALSTFTTMIDDVTTWALVLEDSKRSRPGVSVTLQNKWGTSVALRKVAVGDEVEIAATVNKIGRSMGFVQASVHDVATGELVCHGSHVKFLSSMGMVADFLLSSRGWPLAKLYADYMEGPSPEAIPTTHSLFEAVKYTSETSATIQVTPGHRSLGGPIHGGAQAVLMELLAREFAQNEWNSSLVSVDTIHVEYMSPPSRHTKLDLLVTSRTTPNVMELEVRLLGDGNSLKTKGYLTVSNSASDSVAQSNIR